MAARTGAWRGLAAFGLAIAAMTGAAGAEDGVTADRILLGIEENGNSFSLDEENLGFRLAFTERNAQGPIHGRTIAWKGYTKTGGAAVDEAVANARKLVEQDKVFALMNYGGPAAIPVGKLADEKRVPLLFPHTALISSEGRRYVFTSFPRYEGEAKAMLRYLAKERGLKKIAIVHDTNVYGQLFLRLLKEHAAEFGYAVTGNAGVATRDPADLSAELKALADGGAEAVMMALYPAQAKTLMAAKGKLGWKGRMISVGPLTDEQYLNAPGGVAEGTLGFCYYPDPDKSPEPGVAAYRAAMAKYHPSHPLNRYSLYGYVFGKLTVAGLERAGPNLTRETFVDAMESLKDWDAGGIMPKVTFSKTNHHAQRAGFICELKNARFEPLSGWIEP